MPSKRKPKDDEQSIASESKGPVKNVPALMGEGEKFFRDQLYDKAIQCYTEALELSPGNKNALVERAACYLKTGKNQLALADADVSLEENKEFAKGLYQKAEALYAMGEFESALVFYHRGKKLRGDVREFQLGINKAQEAIDNCVGDPNTVKLEIKGDLSYFDKPDEKQKKQQKAGGYQKPLAQKQQVVQKREKRTLKPGNQKTIKQLLGELYADKVYLEQLLQDDHATRANTKTGDAIWGLANNGLDFLDSRTEFWRQQKPIYARKKQPIDSNSKNPLNYILKQLEVIDNLQSSGKHSESLDKSNKLMIYVNKLSEGQIQDKKAIVANIYSNIGNAHLEMGKYDLALQAHQKDLDISKETDNKEGISRAYENIGRVYARNGKYKEAIEVWEKKLPLADSDMEKAWLYHEIGRCHLELGEYETAKDCGKKSLEYSEKIKDEVWQLNATVLIAQSEAKMGDVASLESAIGNFEQAIKMTEKQNDEAAGKAIKKALGDCREKLKKLQVGAPVDKDESSSKKTSPVPEKTSPSPQEKKAEKESTVKQEQAKPEKGSIDYKVQVKTSNDISSGTDANAYISLYGDKGDLSDMLLTSEKDKFESGKVDECEFNQLKDIGKLKKIKIGHDGTNSNSSWKIEYVKVFYSGNSYHFNANQWLDVSSKKNGDKLVSIELEPSKTEDNLIQYQIDVKTADEMSAGTDAKVVLTIVGAEGEVKIDLNRPINNKNPFEKNALDKFELNEKKVGKIKKIKLNLDGSGAGSSWKLESIKILVNKETYSFTYNNWIDTDAELNPDGDSEKNQTTYEVQVKTADDTSSGTDATVKLTIVGANGQISSVLKEAINNKNPFEQDALDKFEFIQKDVGKIKKITLDIEGGGLGSSWKLEYIKICVEKMYYTINVNNWLEKGTYNFDLTEEPMAASDIAEYVITAVTGNKIGAGTDSNVFIIIYGDKGDTKKQPLKFSNNKNPFEKGKTDLFKITAKNVGDIKKINISHDGQGIGAGWYCDRIEVKNQNTGITKNFPVDRWLDAEEGDGKTALDLEPDKKP